MSRKDTRLKQNPLCLCCREEMIPRGTSGNLICYEAKTGKPHTCDRYIEGVYRPAKEALKRHRRRIRGLSDV